MITIIIIMTITIIITIFIKYYKLIVVGGF